MKDQNLVDILLIMSLIQLLLLIWVIDLRHRLSDYDERFNQPSQWWRRKKP